MKFENLYQRFSAFGLAFALGLFATAYFYGIGFSNIFEKEFEPAAKTAVSKVNRIRNGIGGNVNGASGGCDNGDSEITEETTKATTGKTEGVDILSKPRANYTVEARANQIQGKVVLRVTFMASGEIGGIFPIKELPDGLTEQATAAARKIEFKPATRNGVAISVTKPVEYTFTIY